MLATYLPYQCAKYVGTVAQARQLSGDAMHYLELFLSYLLSSQKQKPIAELCKVNEKEFYRNVMASIKMEWHMSAVSPWKIDGKTMVVCTFELFPQSTSYTRYTRYIAVH